MVRKLRRHCASTRSSQSNQKAVLQVGGGENGGKGGCKGGGEDDCEAGMMIIRVVLRMVIRLNDTN